MLRRESIRSESGRRLRRVIESCVLLTIVGAMASTFFIEGWLVPIVVSSGSMATTLLGPHRHVKCADCGFEFVCDAENLPDAGRATCPNCGRPDNAIAPKVIAGDRMLIDRATFAGRAPRRWEVAVFSGVENA